MSILSKFDIREGAMTLLHHTSAFIQQNWPALIVTATLYKCSMFYLKKLRFPSGPFPIPFVGNLPALARVGGSFHRAAEQWRSVHGDIFTVWIGERPWIFINDQDAINTCNDASHQLLFAGRERTETGDVQMQGNTGVIFSDSGAAQQLLRSVAAKGVRKYLQRRPGRYQPICDFVDAFLEERMNTQIESKQVAEDLVQSVSLVTVFGSLLRKSDQDELRDAHRRLEENCPSGLPSDVLPIFKYLLYKRQKAGMEAFLRYNNVTRGICMRTADIFLDSNADDIRCVTDAVLLAAAEARHKDAANTDILTRGNIVQAVFDLFEAGSQTSVITLHWALLKLASCVELQRELQKEIDALGYFPPRKEHHVLPLLQSFIKEVLRFYPAAPFGLPRKLTKDVTIGKHHLRADSIILFNLYNANRDAKSWEQGKVFDARRFLDKEGKFDDTIRRGFFTFGVGARSCVGTTVAIDNLFFILARILQKCRIVGPDSEISLTPVPAALMLDAPIHNLKFVPRN